VMASCVGKLVWVAPALLSTASHSAKSLGAACASGAPVMATSTLRFLYNAENREFSFNDVSPTSTVLAAKQLVVERWPTGALSTRVPCIVRCQAPRARASGISQLASMLQRTLIHAFPALPKRSGVRCACADMTNRPPDVSHIRLLFAGKFLEDDKVLQDLPHFSASETTTFHLLVMPPPSDSKAGAVAAGSEKAGGTGGSGGARSGSSAGRCQCVIS